MEEDPDKRWEKSHDSLLKVIPATDTLSFKLGIGKTLYANMIYELAMWQSFAESISELKLNETKLWPQASIESLREKHCFSIFLQDLMTAKVG